LFLERGRQARPGFDADPAASSAVVTLCARLDGLPLALELAAPWLRTLTAGEIEAGLDDRFALLVRGPRGVLARHETLLASMSWSHDMLTRADQAVFRRLGVFVGSFSLDAARPVGAAAGLSADAILAAVSRLVDKSLLVVEHHQGVARYRMLETVRAYARARLAEAGEETATRERHLAYFLELVERAEPELSTDTDAWRLRLEVEHDNLREALDWGLAAETPERGRRLAAGLAWLWHLHGHGREGFAILRRAISRDPTSRSLLQARLLTGIAIVADTADPLDLEFDVAQRALELAVEHGDEQLRSLCLRLTAIGQLYTDFEAAWRLNLEAEQIAQQTANGRLSDSGRTLRGAILHLRDRHDEAEPLLQRATDGLLARGERHIAATTLAYQASSEAYTGRLDAALRTAERAVAIAEPLSDYHRVGTTRSTLALIQGLRGDLDAGLRTIAPVLQLVEGILDDVFIPWMALAIGRLHLWRDEPQLALPWLEREAGSTDRGRETYLAAQALPVLGTALHHLQQHAKAHEKLQRAVASARELGMPRVLADALEQQAHLAQADDPDTALELHHAALRIRTERGLRTFYPDSLDGLAALAAVNNRPDRAVRLLAASDRERETIGYPRPPIAQPAHRQLVASTREALGTASFASEWDAGAGLPIDAALAYASRGRGARERPSTGWGSLTPTEREVAQLAIEGCTNPQIAAQLFMSRGTVKTHLSHIYAKLSVTNRTELATRTHDSPGRQVRPAS
jgi:DNA-binding CsgD family transcriptional regulator